MSKAEMYSMLGYPKTWQELTHKINTVPVGEEIRAAYTLHCTAQASGRVKNLSGLSVEQHIGYVLKMVDEKVAGFTSVCRWINENIEVTI